MKSFKNYSSKQTFQTDTYVAKTSRFEYQPEVTIQPESIMDCTMGGYVTISPLVKGISLTYSWQIIHPDNYIEFLANEHHLNLTLGPITRRHLTMRYRMLATDCYGNSVYTNVSTMQLSAPIKTKRFELAILDSHPISLGHRLEKDPFKGYENWVENNSSRNNFSNVETIFEKVNRDIEKIKEVIKDANISLDQMNSQENIRNPNNIYLPVFISQPLNSKLFPGQDLLLECNASKARSYTWYFNSEPIRGYNNNSLRISMVTKENEGAYSCAVRNEFGFVLSECVTVSVVS